MRTLDEWRQRFWRVIDDVRSLGFDTRFVRMWDFYLASCSAVFATGHIRDVHVMLERVRDAVTAQMPPTAATTIAS